jgi:hypothetical protein
MELELKAASTSPVGLTGLDQDKPNEDKKHNLLN